jgi:hypothetical protein
MIHGVSDSHPTVQDDFIVKATLQSRGIKYLFLDEAFIFLIMTQSTSSRDTDRSESPPRVRKHSPEDAITLTGNDASEAKKFQPETNPRFVPYGTEIDP